MVIYHLLFSFCLLYSKYPDFGFEFLTSVPSSVSLKANKPRLCNYYELIFAQFGVMTVRDSISGILKPQKEPANRWTDQFSGQQLCSRVRGIKISISTPSSQPEPENGLSEKIYTSDLLQCQ